MTIDRHMAASIAATRFGLGARPGEIDNAAGDARAFLTAQIRQAGADPTGPTPATTGERVAQYRIYKLDRSLDKQKGTPKSSAELAAHKALRDEIDEDFLARVLQAVATPDGFRERWALFWTNHFAVSGAKMATGPFVAPFENEAVRPRVFGRFEDLLVASSTHPAMLRYLDQAQSIGPDSAAARSQALDGKRGGLNENLAREILELHTVGLAAGYTQTDVTEFARAMTGWSVGGDHDPGHPGLFMFHERAHQPGPRTIMGRRYPEGGMEQARAIMKDLAASPHTASHLATKIARHFVADAPPAALVARLRQSYLATDGDLAAVARTLVAAPESWDPAPRKFKTPYEFLISAWRATNVAPRDTSSVNAILAFMGQKPYEPPSPKGWPDEGDIWCAPDAVIKRMNWSTSFAAANGADRDPMQLASNALGARLGARTAMAVSRAETRTEGLAILLMSPEFQRR